MKRIILVEDSVHDCYMLRECFEDAGLQLEIVEINYGDQAEQYFQQSENQDFDLVLLDVNLPRRNGYQVLRTIRKQPAIAHKPVVMMSISKMKPTPIEEDHYQPDFFWLKPNNPKEFCEITNFVNKHLKQTN